MRWTDCRVVAFDTETTGLNPLDGDRIIEFAAVELTVDEDLQVVATKAHDFLINPQISIPRAAMQVTGITDADVAGKPTFERRAAEVRRVLEGAVIVAHNLPFDLAFLRMELERAGSAWPPTRAEVDTLSLSQRRMSDLRVHKLANVARALGVPLDNAHRATHDAEACGRVLVEMARRHNAPRDIDGFVAWADALAPPPDTGHLALGANGMPQFQMGPHTGEGVEAHPDHLQWMTMALERRDGAWQPRFPDSVREWARRWLRVRGAGRIRGAARSQGSQDWTLDPAPWR